MYPFVARQSHFADETGRADRDACAPEQAAAPTYWFKGKKDEFINNLGTGGPFVKVGTVNDVAGPSI
jgi:hypothetical protein